jgi:SAM-dependent methyltransferase
VGGCYGEDLAYIHDAGFADVAVSAAEFVVAGLRTRGFERGTVTDLGCGSGVLAARLTALGYTVFGVDISPAFVELARRRAPGAEFMVGSFLCVGMPPSIAVTAVGEVLNYHFDAANGPPARRAFFRRCHEALAARGILVFDMAGPGRASAVRVGTKTVAGSDWQVSATTDVAPSGLVLTRRITVQRRVAGGTRSTNETHRLLLAEPAELLEELREAGFEAHTLPSYGGQALPGGVSVFVGVKR